MSNKKIASLPVGVVLISASYALGAIFLLVLFFIDPEPAAAAIAERHGLPGSTGSWILPAIAGLGLLIAYGLFSLSRWGFILTGTYLLYFGVVNFYLFGVTRAAGYGGDVLWSVLVVVYLILVRKRFLEVGKAKEIHGLG